ncbi:ATP-dependent RNA helicase A [Blomia tropicalis]|nr:ATP-dependent RNA helicase A [Blomia tropicalis]
MDYSKAALNIWCSKKKLKSNHDYNSSQRGFCCKITIESMSHTAIGEGQNKKLASNNAALAMMVYLVENKYITKKELEQPCYSMLDILPRLFPDGEPMTLSKLSKTMGEVSLNSNQTKSTNPQSFPKTDEPKQDWWNVSTNSNNVQSSVIKQLPSTSPQPPNRNSSDRFGGSRYRGARPTPYPNSNNGKSLMSGAQWNRWNSEYPSNSNYVNENPCHNPYEAPNIIWQMDQSGNPFPQPTPQYSDRSWQQSGSNTMNMKNNSSNNLPIEHQSANNFQRPTSKSIPTVGNFTLDNAKQQLHQFMQSKRIKITDFEYDSRGPPHCKVFTARLHFFVRDLKRVIDVTESGCSKQDASRRCALSIIKQLYNEGHVRKYDPDALSKRQLMKNNIIYQINVSKELENMMINVYQTVQQYNMIISPEQAYSLSNKISLNQCENQPSYLYWCPPLPDYNPWLNTKLDDDVYKGKSMEDINHYLQDQFHQMITNVRFQQILTTRSQLPIYVIKDKVISLINDHSVLIIKGSTGCGKTTQVPQFILDSFIRQGNGANCNIVVTQPRRISAISISERVAYERVEPNGCGSKAAVGYSVRFNHVYPRPYGSILFCTTGHLLRRIQNGLKGVSHIIIDEVHERDTNTDLLLVIVRDLIQMGLELKVVIMSATIGVQRFQTYFNNCHVLEIDGALFPVQRYFLEDTIEIIKWNPKKITYLDDDADATDSRSNPNDSTSETRQDDLLIDYDYSRNYSQRTINLVNELRDGVICFELILSILEYIQDMYITGAVLVFLPGWSTIFEMMKYLQKHPKFGDTTRFQILPLHSRLNNRDNHRVFQKVPQRKIILSTNIAETSITIDDVVFVIDSCLLKRKVYCARTNVTSYIIDWVSKSNIQQRQGRAGRVRSGYFFALCSKKRYDSLEEFKVPEILVTSLVETSLLIKYLGFGNVPKFLEKCLDPPPKRSVTEALITLRDINAFNRNDDLTPLGAILVKLPIDPRLGRMVMLSLLLNIGAPSVTIAAISAITNDLFDTISQMDATYRAMLKLDENRISDHLIMFQAYHTFDRQVNMDEYRETFNMNSILQVQNARRQLVEIFSNCGFPEIFFTTKPTYTETEYEMVVGLLVSAFYPNICLYKESRKILTNEEKIGLIHKTSVLYSYVQNQRITRPSDLKSPLMVYSEKSASRNLISSKHMSMISFMQLLLFGIRRYEFPPVPQGENVINDTVLLDGWLEVRIDPKVFDCCLLIKSELENILIQVCDKPETLNSLSHIQTSVVECIREMCFFKHIKVDYVINPIKNG